MSVSIAFLDRGLLGSEYLTQWYGGVVRHDGIVTAHGTTRGLARGVVLPTIFVRNHSPTW